MEGELCSRGTRRAVSMSPGRIAKFVGVGLIEPCTKTRFGPAFSESFLDRLRRILRLRRDLGVNLAGAAVPTGSPERESDEKNRRSSDIVLRSLNTSIFCERIESAKQ
jgi:hypothetical protein